MKRTLFQTTILVFVTLLFLSACSIKTVYNNLDWVLEGMVDDYISLSETQEQDVERQVAQLMKWHKATQLTEYANDFKAIKAFTAKGIDDESAEIIFATFMKRWNSMKEKVAPEMADLFLTLSDKQIEELFARLEEENKEVDEKYKETTEQEKIELGGEKLIDSFSDWLGPLNDEQKRVLKSWPQRFKPTHEDRVNFRIKWQAALKQVLVSDEMNEDKRAQLIAMVETPSDYQSEEHRKKLVYNSKQIKELIITFEHTVTSEQKKHLAERLDYFISNFEELAAEAEE